MQAFEDFAANRAAGGTCLYLGTGPSLHEAHRFASDHAVAVACIGEAGLLVPDRPLQWLFFNNWKRANASRSLFDRTEHIVCPESVHDDETGAKHDVTKLDWLPQEKLIVYPRRKKANATVVEQIRRALQNNELVPFAFSAMILLALHLLGYRRILCFGHDGGFHHAAGMLGGTDLTYDYADRAQQVRKFAKVISQNTETTLHFWPDIPQDVAA